MRGPSKTPRLIALRRSTVQYPPRESMSRTVVKPASRSACAFATARIVRVECDSSSGGYTWTWASIIPGRPVAALRSMTRASGGIATDGPTSAMRSPRTSTVWLATSAPERLSNRRPARIAMTCPEGTRNLPGALAIPPCPSATADKPTAMRQVAVTTRVTSRMTPPILRCETGGLKGPLGCLSRTHLSRSACLAAILSPAPVVGSTLDSLETDTIVVGGAIGRRPDPHPLTLAERALGDAIAFEARHTRPLDGIDRRPPEGVLTLNMDPRVRVLVLDLQDLALYFDGVFLEIELRKRVVPQERSRQAHDSGHDERPQLPCHLTVLPWQVPTDLLWSSSDPDGVHEPARAYRNPAGAVRCSRPASRSTDLPVVRPPAR